MGRLGTTVAGTESVFYWWPPKLSTENIRRLQMNKFRFTIKILVIATFLLAFASIAQAQATRTWVSGVGDDANPCSRTAPCKTWAGAISKTADCGEIDALDPGGFGTVTITKSITLDGTGTMASILAAGTTGVIINADNTKVITLRGISINGACTGTNGVNILQAKHVNIEDCVIFRFSQNGIVSTDSDGLGLNVRNTVLRDNAGDGANLSSTNVQVKATFDNVGFNGNTNGLHARQGSRVTVHNSTLSNNGSNGVWVDGNPAASIAVARIWTSIISGNGAAGVLAGLAANAGTSKVEIAQNQINHNVGNGVTISTGGSVETYSNNSIVGNAVDGCGGCTPSGPGG
jgi:hypothetical protein